MEKQLTVISRPAALEVQRIVAPDLTSNTGAIELIITLRDKDLNFRDLSRFFMLVDRVYGRLLYGDLRRYAWAELSQLHVSRIRAGSWEVVINQILDNIPNPTPILILYLFLKLLPKALRESADGVLKLSSAYHNYEQARLARANRKKLREQMEKDEELRQLLSQRKKELSNLVDRLVREDTSISRPAIDFAAGSLVSIKIRLIKKQPGLAPES
jgi:hypothetical protein